MNILSKEEKQYDIPENMKRVVKLSSNNGRKTVITFLDKDGDYINHITV